MKDALIRFAVLPGIGNNLFSPYFWNKRPPRLLDIMIVVRDKYIHLGCDIRAEYIHHRDGSNSTGNSTGTPIFLGKYILMKLETLTEMVAFIKIPVIITA